MSDPSNPPQIPQLPTEPPTQAEHAEALITAGQRRINFLWELTQAFIVIMVISTNMVATWAVMFWGVKSTEIPTAARDAMVIIIMFYFQRTNHTLTGGVGKGATTR